MTAVVEADRVRSCKRRPVTVGSMKMRGTAGSRCTTAELIKPLSNEHVSVAIVIRYQPNALCKAISGSREITVLSAAAGKSGTRLLWRHCAPFLLDYRQRGSNLLIITPLCLSDDCRDARSFTSEDADHSVPWSRPQIPRPATLVSVQSTRLPNDHFV